MPVNNNMRKQRQKKAGTFDIDQLTKQLNADLDKKGRQIHGKDWNNIKKIHKPTDLYSTTPLSFRRQPSASALISYRLK